MTRWRDRQREMAMALLNVEPGALPPPPRGVVDPGGATSPRRFNVYRNNIAAGLIDVLEASYPAIGHLLGEDSFRETARRFAMTRPPTSPVMALYGAEFPDFIASFEPMASLPYLADVARIERGWVEAYHAAEAPTLNPIELAAMNPEEYAALRFIAHPSLRLLRSRYPALTIWRMNIADGTPGNVDLSVNEDALVVRPEADVLVHAVPPGGATFLAALLRGQSLAAAADSARNDGAPDFDLAMHLRGLLQSRAFSAVRLPSRARN